METLPKPKKKARKQTAKVSKKQVDLSQRRWLVLELRKQGATYREIAEQLIETFGKTGEHGISSKYSHVSAISDFKEALAELNERNSDELEENRRLDLERLDALLAGSFDRASQGDPVAVGIVMGAIKERSIWFGYAAPAKVETTLTGKDGAAIQVEAVNQLSDDELNRKISELLVKAGTGIPVSTETRATEKRK